MTWQKNSYLSFLFYRNSMMQTRREFIKKSALAAAGGSLLSLSLHAGFDKKIVLGIQLYSVRDEMKKDPRGTLEELAKIGYKYVEHANYTDRKFYGWTAREFKKVLKDLGMSMPSGHTVLSAQHWDNKEKDFSSEWKYTIEDAATMGQRFVISPWLDEKLRQTYDGLLRQMEIFNRCGELCNESGMKFGYHNHDFEFSQKLKGTAVYDIILQNTEPGLVMQQLDTGNLYNGGAKAIDIVKQYPGRFESMHVKDEIPLKSDPKKFESTIIGSGIVNVNEVLKLGRSAGGTMHFIVEQEAYQGKSPMECARENYVVMKGWGY